MLGGIVPLTSPIGLQTSAPPLLGNILGSPAIPPMATSEVFVARPGPSSSQKGNSFAPSQGPLKKMSNSSTESGPNSSGSKVPNPISQARADHTGRLLNPKSPHPSAYPSLARAAYSTIKLNSFSFCVQINQPNSDIDCCNSLTLTGS